MYDCPSAPVQQHDLHDVNVDRCNCTTTVAAPGPEHSGSWQSDSTTRSSPGDDQVDVSAAYGHDVPNFPDASAHADDTLEDDKEYVGGTRVVPILMGNRRSVETVMWWCSSQTYKKLLYCVQVH